MESGRLIESAPAAGDELDLLHVGDLAELWKVTSNWIRKATNRTTDPLPCIRLGRYIRFQERDVREWLERQKTIRTKKPR
jgi:predicted DNA-binding transcriptional regulator AlpA